MVPVEKIIVPKFWLLIITKSSQKIQTIFITIIFLTGLIPFGNNKVVAQTVLTCNLTRETQNNINTAIANYEQPGDLVNKRSVVSNTFQASLVVGANQIIQFTSQGIEDEAGNLVSALGIISTSLIEEFQEQGLNQEEANVATVASISQWAALSADSSSEEVVATIKQSLIEKIGDEKKEIIEQIPDVELLTALSGLSESGLQALGLSETEIETAASQEQIIPQAEGSLIDQIRTLNQALAEKITRPEAQDKITALQTQLELELNNIRQGDQTSLASGTKLRFKFRLENQSEEVASIELPTIQTITDNGLTGVGTVTGVSYRLATAESEESQTITDVSQDVSIPGGQSLDIEVQVESGTPVDNSISTIGINLQADCSDRTEAQTLSILPTITIIEGDDGLIDPRGEISGCSGEILPDYQGFSVGIYDLDPNDPTESEIVGVTPLTTTELPDDRDNNIPPGIEPNIENSNPFFLTNNDQGKYSFLFDEEKGQLDKGRNYILLVDPGENSIYSERRIKITIGDRQERVVEYTATSLDGRPITAFSEESSVTGEIVLVEDAERVGLDLAVLDLSTGICDAEEIGITKTGDRAAAEPGDIVLYRLVITNLSSVPLTNFEIIDTLPAGFRLESDSVRAETGSELVSIETTQNNRLVNFSTDITLAQTEVLNVVYAAQITPDALRGSGENSAIVNAERSDNDLSVKDGPAIHSLRLEPGIIEDAGILIGRVFVDKNFDGEQQSGEPGIPNAVLYLEDGNRVITDADGLFSVTNLLPGHHTGTLDLTSIPEYGLAPNLRFSEANSTSRLVNLEPGGMVRMNFGVTPTAKGAEEDETKKTE